MPFSFRRAAPLLSVLAFSCASESRSDSVAPLTQTPETPEASTGESWSRLIEGSWTLGPGEEKTRFCVKKELTEDIYIKAIRPVHPRGTHHTLLSIGDGKIDCTTAVAQGLIYAAGVGSEGLELPEGVAIKLPKGKFLNLGLHLYNTSEDTLEGTSAMEVVTVDADDVKYESEALLAGPLTLNLPPHEETVVSNDCTLTADQKFYALFPHMHQYGTHLKTTLTIGGEQQVIHDGDYRFDEQYQLPLDPVVEMHAGDTVTTTCTYDNTSSKAVTFGESSDTEMCFSILFRYPALGQGFCTQGGSSKPMALAGPPCAAPGAPGDAKGIGKECSKGGGECDDNAGASVCVADYTTGQFGNFCTTLCDSDADCGDSARCQGKTQKICIPTQCIADGGI